jgi:Rrf2 family protein
MRALCYLAERYGQGMIHTRAIATDEDISAKFLESIMLQLRRAGFVTSRRGGEGGHALSRPPETITLGEAIRVLDGPLAPMASAAELHDLMERNPRQLGFYATLIDVRDAVSGILDGTSLADVVRRNQELKKATTEE